MRESTASGVPHTAAGTIPEVPLVLQKTPADADKSSSSASASLAVHAEGVCKSYEIGGVRRTILDHVHFRVERGKCVFLVGPSGSGKSTLLSILGCLLSPDSGYIKLAGKRVDDLSVEKQTQFRRQHIGFVFQRFQLISALSAMDNIALPLSLQGVSKPDARSRAMEMLEKVGLETHATAKPGAMSPGQCQRIAMGRALVTRPPLLLADEPTAALDAKSGQDAMKLMRQLIAETGTSTIVVTHDPRIYDYADRVCEIEEGKLR
ncbi:MAG: ABC transporter ATP-binding protein [Planctomycetota bacterium]